MRIVGIGTRVLNFLVDTTIVFILAYIAYKVWVFYVYYYNYPFYPIYYFIAVVLFLYYTIFESIRGRTPGKWLSVSRVVSKNGQRANLWQILTRSLVRLTVIDCFFIPFLKKPLHDYLSNTIVIDADKDLQS